MVAVVSRELNAISNRNRMSNEIRLRRECRRKGGSAASGRLPPAAGLPLARSLYGNSRQGVRSRRGSGGDGMSSTDRPVAWKRVRATTLAGARHVGGRLSSDERMHLPGATSGRRISSRRQSAGVRAAHPLSYLTTFWSMAPKMEAPSASNISMRTRSPNFMKPVLGSPYSIVSIERRSAMQAEPTRL